MPPPIAPPRTLRPPMMTPPYWKPRSTVTGPMESQKLNHSPGTRLRPSMSKRRDVDVVAEAVALAGDVVRRPAGDELHLRSRRRRLGRGQRGLRDLDGHRKRRRRCAPARSLSVASSADAVASTIELAAVLAGDHAAEPAAGRDGDLGVDWVAIDLALEGGNRVGQGSGVDARGVVLLALGPEAQPSGDGRGRDAEAPRPRPRRRSSARAGWPSRSRHPRRPAPSEVDDRRYDGRLESHGHIVGAGGVDGRSQRCGNLLGPELGSLLGRPHVESCAVRVTAASSGG